MPTIIIPGRTLSTRPQYGFGLNVGSPFANGLAAWLAAPGMLIGGPNGAAGSVAFVSGSALAAGPHGLAFVGDAASGQYTTFPSALNLNVPFSVALWGAQVTAAGVTNYSWCSTWNSGVHAGVFGQMGGGALVWSVGYAVGGGSARRSATGVTTPTAGTWGHYVAVCRAATDWSLYYNGKSEIPSYSGAGTGTFSNSANVGNIGREFTATVLSTQVADLRIWNRALTDTEAFELYDARSRWDLYWVPSRRAYVSVSGFNPAWAIGSNSILGANPC